MGYVTVLLSGVPKYVSLGDLGYYLECLFTTNSEIGPFEVRYLPQGNNKPVVALDFRSGFDAIAAQEQLDGYRYEMQDGTQYILHAKITKREEFMRGDISAGPSWSQSRSSSTEKESCSSLALATMSDGAMFRANAMLDAKYKLLKKQKLIVQTEMELIRERRKLRREYGEAELLESDDEPAEVSSKPRSRSTSRESKSFSQELELYKIRRTTKRQKLKAIECHCKESASISKLRSTRWDQPPTSQIQDERDSRERSFRKYKSKKMRSRAASSRSLSRSPRKSCSRLRSSSPDTVRSMSRTPSPKTRRSKSQTPSPKTRRSKSRTSSPKTRRSRSRTSGLKIRRPRTRTRHNRSSSCDSESRERSCKRISKKIERSLTRISRSKRLRSPESCSRSRTPKSRNKPRLLAIMPKSPEKRETQTSRSRNKPPAVDNSDIEIKITKKRAERDDHSSKIKIKSLRDFADMKTETDLLNKKDCTTSVTGATIEKDKHKKIKSTHPATDINRNKSGTLEDNKYIRDSIKNSDKQISKDTNNKIKEKIKEDSAHRKLVKSDETKIRLICDDIMFLMKSLLLEISVKENIIISHSTTKLIAEKLTTVIHERVKVLYVKENLSVYNALDIYRKICTKEDDIRLLKRMLKEVRTQETGTEEKGNQNTLEKDANDNNLAEKSIQDMSKAKVDAVKKKITEEDVHRNEGQLERTVEIDKENKATEYQEVIDLESYCPNESWIEASKIQKIIPDSPQFVLVVKRLMKQLKPVLRKSAQKGVNVNYFDMRQVLRILLKDMLKGEGEKQACGSPDGKRPAQPTDTSDTLALTGYKPTKQIMAFFRKKYPRDNDEEFVKQVAEDISLKKYDIEGMDKDSQDYGDVILIETNPEVVTIEDSDDDSDEIRKEIIAVINSLDEQTGNQTTNEACKFLPEINILKEAINRITDKKDETRNNTEATQSEKANVADDSITPTEVCNKIIKQETQQLDEAGKNPKTAHICVSSRNEELKNADTTVNKEVQRTETELRHENERESLKVTAITIVTSESELHSIAHGLETGNEGSKELKQEVDPELTEADIEKILSLDVNFDECNTSEACEKEAPQVTAITIMTSASELLSLKMDPDGNRVKEVPEVKVENNVDNETTAQDQSNEYVENAALDINAIVGNSTNAEVIRPEQDRRMIDTEEETIESICKFVTSLCDNNNM